MLGRETEFPAMKVERTKIILWASDMARSVHFYQTLFDAKILRQNDAITELEIAGGIIGIHSGGDGERTWTGLSFQVPDVVAGAEEVVAAGGQVPNPPSADSPDEPPHLAMCIDPDGNDFMLSRKRGGS